MVTAFARGERPPEEGGGGAQLSNEHLSLFCGIILKKFGGDK
jgi:hypothetical protein